MPPLNTSATVGAVPDVNVKLTIDRLSRNVRLVLLADGVFGQLATAALRTALRQRSIPVLIDLLRDHSPCLRPIIVTRLAAWRFRNGHLWLSKRSRLTLARTPSFLERFVQLRDFFPQLTKLLLELPATAAFWLLSDVFIHDRRKLKTQAKMRNPICR